ncbi:hypothetical protein ACROYT_G015323 [Oculina patagonica]
MNYKFFIPIAPSTSTAGRVVAESTPYQPPDFWPTDLKKIQQIARLSRRCFALVTQIANNPAKYCRSHKISSYTFKFLKQSCPEEEAYNLLQKVIEGGEKKLTELNTAKTGKAKKDQKEQLEEALESSQDEADLQEDFGRLRVFDSCPILMEQSSSANKTGNIHRNFYGKAIRDNKDNAGAMSKATHAILKHYSSTPANPHHEDCPAGKDSWCSYNRDVATGETTHCPIQDPLPQGDEHFLAGCVKCLEQNNNECLHHVIWGMAPKEQFISQQEASLVVALGELVFNNGLETTFSKLMRMVNIQVQNSVIEGWNKIDEERISTSN